MNKKEFFAVIVGLKAAYPRFTFLSTDEEMEFWYQMLQDIDYRVAHNAVMEFVGMSIYPPSIADIRRLCAERCAKAVPTFDEAWGTVLSAIVKYGRDHPQEAYATMDDLTVSVVKNLGWYNLCTSENPSADRANFREAYEAKARALQSRNQIPEFVVRDKEMLQAQYIPAVAERTVPRIEDAPVHDVRDELKPGQLKARSEMVEKVRRELLGGGKTSDS